jgi:hypothetical protein
MCGWIKIHRSMLDHWIASDPEFLAVWVRMLSDANFTDKTTLFNGSLITVNRGQIIFGLEAYSKKTGVGISKLRRMIKLLEKDLMIDRQINNKFSLISILNYEKYQGDDRQAAPEPQADDRRPATSKEGNKVNNNINVDSDESTCNKKDVINKLFDTFWKHYGYKQGKQNALKSFSKFLKGKDDKKQSFWMNLMLSYYEHCRSEQVLGYEKLHAATYINNMRWNDDPEFMAQFKQEWINEHNGKPE